MSSATSARPITEPFLTEEVGLELGLLCDALDLLDRGAFLFAVCEEGPLRERLVQQVYDHLEAEGKRDLISVELSPEQSDLAAVLTQRFTSAPSRGEAKKGLPAAVFVYIRGLADAGMEVSGLAEGHPERVRVEQSRRVWRSLNIQRERLSQLNVPLIFWLSQNALGQLMQHAADVFAARSQIFLFQTRVPEPDAPPPMRSEAMVKLLDRFHRTLLPPEELRKRAALYERRLERQRAATEPNWAGIAYICRTLSNIYVELDDYEKAGLLQDEAIEAYQQAIAEFERDNKEKSQEWADLQYRLGLTFFERIPGDRAENIEQAIKAYQQTLRVTLLQNMPVEWATITINLAIAYRNRIWGDRAENLEQAIDALKQTLKVWTQQTMPVEWASTMNSLGNVYALRIRGNRAENLEQAINAYQEALEIRTRQSMPIEWAQTAHNLATAYLERIRGDRTENLEKAMVIYQEALEIRTRQSMPIEWAQTAHNLATAYLDRIRGDRAENLEKAIDILRQVLQVVTYKVMPIDWAQAMTNLGNAYSHRIQGNRADNLEKAVKAYKQALQVRTHNTMPIERAQTMNNLALAYLDRIHGSRSDNLKRAIDAYRQALEVYSHQNSPEHAATIQQNLGWALLHLGQLHQEGAATGAAERSFAEALQIFQELGNTGRVAAAQEILGRLALQTARPAQAQALLKEARQHYTTLDQPDRVEAIDELLAQVEQVD